MRQFQWRPATLEGIYPNGERWVLEEIGTVSPGYPKYIGRVCRSFMHPEIYTSDAGRHTSMHDAARALLQWELSKI